MNNLEPIITIATFILGSILAVFLVRYTKKVDSRFEYLKPASPEDAKRLTLHELECFCPPNWGQVPVPTAMEALSRLYKHLQYASRGRSFLITRAAVWKMLDLLREKTSTIDRVENIIGEKLAMQLYVYKTVIASAIGNQMELPKNPGKEQKEYEKILEETVAHTLWVLKMYEQMNDVRPPSDDPEFALLTYGEASLNEFRRKIQLKK